MPNYQGRVFDRKPMLYDHRRFRLEDFITPTMRKRAASVQRQVWDFDATKVLDQGNTGHCVGFGWADWGICIPISDAYANADGNRIYYESVAIGGVPNSEDGSETEWGAKAMQKNEKRLDAYAFASLVDDIITWLATQGPACTGTNWYSAMMDTDSNGQVHVSGSVVGGHEWLIRGFDLNEGLLYAVQSWGKSWGLGGFFTISIADYTKLFDAQGDCCMAVELPISTPTPTPTPAPTPTPTPTPSGCLPRIARALGIEI